MILHLQALGKAGFQKCMALVGCNCFSQMETFLIAEIKYVHMLQTALVFEWSLVQSPNPCYRTERFMIMPPPQNQNGQSAWHVL